MVAYHVCISAKIRYSFPQIIFFTLYLSGIYKIKPGFILVAQIQLKTSFQSPGIDGEIFN
jgi:hypothetical protein